MPSYMRERNAVIYAVSSSPMGILTTSGEPLHYASALVFLSLPSVGKVCPMPTRKWPTEPLFRREMTHCVPSILPAIALIISAISWRDGVHSLLAISFQASLPMLLLHQMVICLTI